MDFLPSSSRTQRPREIAVRDRTGQSKGGKGREQRVYYKPYAAVQKMPKPPKLNHAVPQVPILRERNSDLRAAYSTKSKRMFREGELLWCYLDPPIYRSQDEIGINFWPALVEEIKLKCEPTPRPPEDVEMTDGTALATASADADGLLRSDPDEDSPPPWTVIQTTVYKMKLLAVSYSYSVSDDRVLPYQGYAPPSDLIEAIREIPWGDLDLRPESLAAFNPCPQDAKGPQKDGSMFLAAVAPYTLAVQIAAKVAGYWSITDEWDFKFLVTPGAAAAAARSEPLHSVIATVASRNAASSTLIKGDSIPSIPPSTRNITGPSHTLTSSELQDLDTRMLGLPPYPAQTVTQTRYQGLWWGAERIWIDELVRLKLARRQLAPDGAPSIYPPSGPSQKTLQYNAQIGSGSNNVSPSDLGAGGRGVFMKLEGLFVVDVPRGEGMGGMRKECRASGMLYELADEDWVDPHSEQQQQDPRDSVTRKPGDSLPNGASGTSTAPNTGLSQPTQTWPYPLPKAPTGFKFRPILPHGHEAVVSLTLLSGRYYPEILRHRLIRPVVLKTYTNPLEQGGLHDGDHLWALEGLCPGYFNSVDPTTVKSSRLVMLRDGDRDAREDMEEACTSAQEDELMLDIEAVAPVPVPE